MKNTVAEKCAAGAVLFFVALSAGGLAAAAEDNSLKPVPLRAVKIDDAFWRPKLKIYRENTIAHSWTYIEDNIKAMKKIAGISDEPCKTGRWTEANLYKFMEAISYSLAVHPDRQLERRLDEIISAIGAAQGEDGYIHAHITLNNLTPWGDLYHQHDGYVSGHLYEAAVAHFRVTGKLSLLQIACRSADQAYRHFLAEKNPGFPGHAEIELGLVELYRVTGQKRYLELAREFIERRGGNPGKECPRYPCEYFQDDVPIRRQNAVRGHAVRAIFFATGVADVALETGDPDMRAAAERLWASAAKRRMYITGSIGARKKHEAFADDYVLPNEGYTESCAVCGMADFAHRMFLLKADAHCADVLERTLYNGILHGISLDGKSFYYRNPLTDKDHPRGNNWCCCPPNLSRTLMKIGRYAYAHGDDDIYVNLYIAGSAEISLRSNKVTLTGKTEYPWEPKVRIVVDPAKEDKFTIKLRIPAWCENAALKLNAAEIEKPLVRSGYAVLNRTWKSGDLIELELPMPVRRIEAHPQVKADNGRVAIQRGPIVYGLEALDNPAGIDISLAVDPDFVAEYRPNFLHGTTIVKGKSSEEKPFTAIPFYALANREKSSQLVWLEQKAHKSDSAGWRGKLYRALDSSNLQR